MKNMEEMEGDENEEEYVIMMVFFIVKGVVGRI